MKIYKYQLEIKDEQGVKMPSEAQILSVGNQHGRLCLWANVYPNNEIVTRSIVICGTGHKSPVGNYKFVGTVIQLDGALVWHVFQRPE